MFWAFFEFSGGPDFEPVAESPFAEGREVDMAPLNPVVVVTKKAAPRPDVVLASINVEEVPELLSSAVKIISALENEAKADALTRPATPAAASDVQVAEDTAASATVTEVARLAVDPTVPVVVSAIEPDATRETNFEPEPERDLRKVAGSRVNMRMGPGTQFDVLAKLVRGDEVEVLRVSDDGWARLRGPDGRVGWMAARLLTPKAE